MAAFFGTNLADTLNGTAFADLIHGNGGNDLLRGNGGDDVIHAGTGNDILEGGTGNDRLYAQSGSNSLFGGDGSDILVSGTGSDLLNGGSGIDLASWEAAAGRVVVNLAAGWSMTDYSDFDTLAGIENLLGSRFDDALSGDGGANQIWGGSGHDAISGGGGGDELSGGSGDDTLDGGAGINSLHGDSGIDTVTFAGATFADVDLGRGASLSSLGVSNLYGIENIRATAGNDFLTGSSGANRIEGMAGADLIDGGEGDDVLVGGSGADTFVFEAVEFGWFGTPGHDSGADVISDFGAGDRIDLRGHFEATDFADLAAGASQFGTDTVLRLGDDTIRIQNFDLDDLASSMFLF